MTLNEELIREGVNVPEYRKQIESGFKDIVKIELEYLDKIEDFIQKLRKANLELKAELQRVKEDKAENEVMYEKVIKEYQAKLENMGGK